MEKQLVNGFFFFSQQTHVCSQFSSTCRLHMRVEFMLGSAKDGASPSRLLLAMKFSRLTSYQSKQRWDKWAKMEALIGTVPWEACCWRFVGWKSFRGPLLWLVLNLSTWLPQGLVSALTLVPAGKPKNICIFWDFLQQEQTTSVLLSLTWPFLCSSLSRPPDNSGTCRLPQNVAVFWMGLGSGPGPLYGVCFTCSYWGFMEFTNRAYLGPHKIILRKEGTVSAYIYQLYI